MKGNNELLLNQATMVAAVQMYLDSLMVKPAPKVTLVEREISRPNSIGDTDSFRVRLTDREPTKEAPCT